MQTDRASRCDRRRTARACEAEARALNTLVDQARAREALRQWCLAHPILAAR